MMWYPYLASALAIALSLAYPHQYLQLYATVWHLAVISILYKTYQFLERVNNSTFLDDLTELVLLMQDQGIIRGGEIIGRVDQNMRLNRQQRNPVDRDSETESETDSDDDIPLATAGQEEFWQRIQPELEATLRQRANTENFDVTENAE